ncbi:Helix-turn-helix [bacterium A37T11]|nr:Helix-turn-helix [bacterium A37T11]
MENTARNTVGKNVKKLREALDLSQLKFAELTGVSRTTIVNIEGGKSGFNLSLIEKILDFTVYNIEELSKENFKVRNDLREELASRYKENLSIYVILNKKPTIRYAIVYKLLNTNLLDKPKEINAITKFFKKLGWLYLGTSIQNELKKMEDEILVQAHPTKKGTNLYSKKK